MTYYLEITSFLILKLILAGKPIHLHDSTGAIKRRVCFQGKPVALMRDFSVCVLWHPEYAQPLVGGIVGPIRGLQLNQKKSRVCWPRSYSSPVQEVYHAYAEPLPVTGPEYATQSRHGHVRHSAAAGLPSTSTFKAAGNQPPTSGGNIQPLLSRTDSCSSAQAQYDTRRWEARPKAPRMNWCTRCRRARRRCPEAGKEGECDVFKEVLWRWCCFLQSIIFKAHGLFVVVVLVVERITYLSPGCGWGKYDDRVQKLLILPSCFKRVTVAQLLCLPMKF